jgi:carboxyl-terminal processing protease
MNHTNPTPNPIIALLSRPILVLCLGLMLATGSFLIGAGMGFGAGRWSQGQSFFGSSVAAAAPECLEASETSHTELAPHMPILHEAVNLLYRDFYGDLPEPDEAVYAAIRGIVGLLDDPNTSFLTPVDADFFRTNLEGAFEGIGARVGWDEAEDTLIIAEPFENQPAWMAGLRRDDLILAVDGESLVGGSLSEAVQKIRGPKGSTVVLTVKRVLAGEETAPGRDTGADAEFLDVEIFDITVVRDRIEIPTISTDRLGENGEIAYIRLNSFNENAGQLVRQAVGEAVRGRAQALVFDLRGNSGGLLREAVRVASVFLQNETVLLERFSDGRTETYTTSGRRAINDMPVVVLVNGGSASASEIVAGALQDSGRALLIGDTTYGKGSVQLPHTLSDGSIMRVTVARWYTPLDRTIDGIGLTPDILVERPEPVATELSEDDPETDSEAAGNDEPEAQAESSLPDPAEGNGNSNADPELEAALEYLQQILQNTPE